MIKFIDPAKKKRKGDLWCPYCGEWRNFKKDNWTGYKRCPDCGMSDHDFHVKTINHLWGNVGIKPRERR
ncbi:hypothetical protein [Heliophilum fasciatum]|uniref:Uncharacterized protein n=1 Tax=Heliophilum fasciatum TaxID=35700 RepID=A0A4R2RJ28_9FIRM|nr:hypothetical protein [Heliophilum fasciatum]MCW2278752.1 DNA-directed RNA polymerase subunit RPC12/RpoP [Heliophilum fasciatum]TCP62509.1 hypothetical protein EDD73_1217 [Heliophilum fasciatum]